MILAGSKAEIHTLLVLQLSGQVGEGNYFRGNSGRFEVLPHPNGLTNQLSWQI